MLPVFTLRHGTRLVGQGHNLRPVYACALKVSALTSTPVPQQVAVYILDVGVYGGPAGDAARGHVGVGLRVNILETFPGNTRAELWEKRIKDEM